MKLQDVSGELRLSDSEGNAIQINFNSDLEYRRKLSGPTTELISKALGKLKRGQHVVDLTAGLAVDSVTITRLGYQVLAVERNPMIAKLLNRAQKTWDSPLKNSLQIYEGDSSHVVDLLRQKKILNLPESEKYTLAYFDPMFPRKKKSALPKQEIVILQKLTNEDPDSVDILQKIIELRFFKRIVIKRPISAAPLVKPTSSLKGKLIRYDIIDFDI